MSQEQMAGQLAGLLLALYIPCWIALIRKLPRNRLMPLLACNTGIAVAYLMLPLNSLGAWFGLCVYVMWFFLLPLALWRVRA
jgi:hypothetical protein